MRDNKDLHRYDDIINLPHHESKTRKRMSLHDRAAQFSPFAALTGYDAAIKETARLTEEWVEPDEDVKTRLDEQLQIIAEHLDDRPEVCITYFVEDTQKEGGAYVTAKGRVRKLDTYARVLVMTDGMVIPIDDVVELEVDMLQ